MRMRFTSAGSAAAAIVLCCACAFAGRAAPPSAAPKPASSNNAFAADFYARVAAGNDGNVFVSPLSVRLALAMTWAGARGRTADELAAAIRIDPNAGPALHDQAAAIMALIKAGADRKDGYELSIANALWTQRGAPLAPAFVDIVKGKYDGSATPLDFARDASAARKSINDWVAARTNDRIKDLMPPASVDGNTRFVLTNAVYFKSAWDMKFNPADSKEAEFRTTTNQRLRATLMYQQALFRYAEDDTLQVLDLPYARDELCMRVFLPRRPTGLAGVEANLTADFLAAQPARMRPHDVQVWLPKFRIETAAALPETLRAMGVTLAFDARRADFGNVTGGGNPNPRLYLTDVQHTAFCKVDETGTEAAAATGVAGGLFGGPAAPKPKPKIFRADRAFAFAIVHRATDTILFMGRVAKP